MNENKIKRQGFLFYSFIVLVSMKYQTSAPFPISNHINHVNNREILENQGSNFEINDNGKFRLNNHFYKMERFRQFNK